LVGDQSPHFVDRRLLHCQNHLRLGCVRELVVIVMRS
jgi:hypothetical protein